MTLGRTLKRRADDVLAYFDRPGTSNPPKRSTADSNTSAAQPSASATSPITSADHCSRPAASDPDYTPNCEEPDNGGLTLLGFLDEDTLLLLVGPATFQGNDLEGERFLVSWQFRTGEFQRISTGGAAMRSITVAPNLVD